MMLTSSCCDLYRRALLIEVPCVIHESVIGRLSLQLYNLADAIQTCSGVTPPQGMCEKHVVAQTRTDVFLTSLNIAGAASSRYEIDIMTIDGSVL